MLWSTAARYGFSEKEVSTMPMSRLRFWHTGHIEMVKEERAALGAAIGRKG